MRQINNRRREYGGGKPTFSYEREYLTIYSLADNNTISWVAQNRTVRKTIYWSKDKVTWKTVTASTAGENITTLQNGEKVYLKGGNSQYATADYTYNYFRSTNEYGVEGNIMSLIYGDSFLGERTLTSSFTFAYLFSSSPVKYTENLILPATTLANYCYSGMFYNCTNLTSVPELPATTLADYCYYFMFYHCTSLTTAPELPATTLANSCYRQMFYNCTNLSSITCLATNISASNCTYDWVRGIAASGTFVEDSTMTSWTTGNSGIPSGWTVQNA